MKAALKMKGKARFNQAGEVLAAKAERRAVKLAALRRDSAAG